MEVGSFGCPARRGDTNSGHQGPPWPRPTRARHSNTWRPRVRAARGARAMEMLRGDRADGVRAAGRALGRFGGAGARSPQPRASPARRPPRSPANTPIGALTVLAPFLVLGTKIQAVVPPQRRLDADPRLRAPHRRARPRPQETQDAPP